jgi:hypothetical protein
MIVAALMASMLSAGKHASRRGARPCAALFLLPVVCAVLCLFDPRIPSRLPRASPTYCHRDILLD